MDFIIESKIVTEDTALKILSFQPRCVACGSTFALHIHHRVFRSEAEMGLQRFLAVALEIYRKSYKREIKEWHLHDIQNLVVLCRDCHEGDDGVGVHGGNMKLRNWLRNRFTCPITGFQVPYFKSSFIF